MAARYRACIRYRSSIYRCALSRLHSLPLMSVEIGSPKGLVVTQGGLWIDLGCPGEPVNVSPGVSDDVQFERVFHWQSCLISGSETHRSGANTRDSEEAAQTKGPNNRTSELSSAE
jgi:hypothetical protein